MGFLNAVVEVRVKHQKIVTKTEINKTKCENYHRHAKGDDFSQSGPFEAMKHFNPD